MKTAAGTAINMPFRERLFAVSVAHILEDIAGDRGINIKNMCGFAGTGMKRGRKAAA